MVFGVWQVAGHTRLDQLPWVSDAEHPRIGGEELIQGSREYEDRWLGNSHTVQMLRGPSRSRIMVLHQAGSQSYCDSLSRKRAECPSERLSGMVKGRSTRLVLNPRADHRQQPVPTLTRHLVMVLSTPGIWRPPFNSQVKGWLLIFSADQD